MWNVRNASVENQSISRNSLVDLVRIEASTTALVGNINNQVTFFDGFGKMRPLEIKKSLCKYREPFG